MSELSGSHLNVSVSEWFTIENHIISTRTADLFKAYDRDLGRGIGLWLLRTPLSDQSDELKLVWERLQKMVSNGVKTSTIYASGLDSQGILYCAIAAPDGAQLAVSNLDVVEAERRFIAVLKILEYMHDLGIVCGDICLSSFWMTRGGEANLIGIMGGYEDLHGPVPPAETLYFLSPEERDAEQRKNSFASDTFALGVLGYYLFTSRYPTVNNLLSTFPESGWMKPSQLVPTSPFWLDDVITRCLDPIPSRRYQRAKEIFKAINEIKEKKIEEQSSLTSRSGTRAIQAKKDVESSMTAASAEALDAKAEAKLTPGGKYQGLVIAGAILLLIVSLAGAAAFYFKPKSNEENLSVLKQAADDRMRAAIEVLNDQSGELKEKRLKYIELQNSDDPLAGNILMHSAQDATDGKERILVEQAILNRSKRLGLQYSVEVVNDWLKTIPLVTTPPEYSHVFNAIDPTIPFDGRVDSLKLIAKSNPTHVVNLSAAYLLDGISQDDQRKLVEVVAPYSAYEDKKASLVTLLLSAKDIPLLNQEKMLPYLHDVPANEFLSFVDYAIRTIHPLRGRITQILSDTDKVNKLRSQYLVPMQMDIELPEEIPIVLLRATYGQLVADDMRVFGQWINTTSERVLLALTVDSYDDNIKKEAIEYLAGRGLKDRAAESYIKWIKKYHWDRRVLLAPIAGALVFADLLSDDQLQANLEQISQYTNDSDLLNIILTSDQNKLVNYMLVTHADYIPTPSLLRLLTHPSSEIRITGILKLKDRNDVTSLQAIIDLYNAESNEDVRKAYRDHMWVIQQRVK